MAILRLEGKPRDADTQAAPQTTADELIAPIMAMPERDRGAAILALCYKVGCGVQLRGSKLTLLSNGRVWGALVNLVQGHTPHIMLALPNEVLTSDGTITVVGKMADAPPVIAKPPEKTCEQKIEGALATAAFYGWPSERRDLTLCKILDRTGINFERAGIDKIIANPDEIRVTLSSGEQIHFGRFDA